MSEVNKEGLNIVPASSIMDSTKNLPARNPATENETRQAFNNLHLSNSQRITESHAEDDMEQIPTYTPTDANVGQSKSLKDAIADALLSKPQQISADKTYTTGSLRSSPSSELLKIENLDDYMHACAEYRRGLSEGWGKECLLKMIEEIGGSKG